jgi:hypothetical protein
VGKKVEMFALRTQKQCKKSLFILSGRPQLSTIRRKSKTLSYVEFFLCSMNRPQVRKVTKAYKTPFFVVWDQRDERKCVMMYETTRIAPPFFFLIRVFEEGRPTKGDGVVLGSMKF